jgi:fumarate hydratase class II
MTDSFRIESDTMGEMRVPASALYGPQTARAIENFPLGGKRFPPSFIRALALVKSAAANVNGRLGQLPAGLAAAIEAASE